MPPSAMATGDSMKKWSKVFGYMGKQRDPKGPLWENCIPRCPCVLDASHILGQEKLLAMQCVSCFGEFLNVLYVL